MSESQLTLTKEEKDFLADLLQEMMKETKIEEHRTRTLSYREIVVQKEHLLASVLGKLGKPAS